MNKKEEEKIIENIVEERIEKYGMHGHYELSWIQRVKLSAKAF